MGAWIEIIPDVYSETYLWSHPTMGAWIEIERLFESYEMLRVAPHDGCVD